MANGHSVCPHKQVALDLISDHVASCDIYSTPPSRGVLEGMDLHV